MRSLLLVALLSCMVVAISADCVDVRPPGDGNKYSCEQQVGWGKCNEQFMQGYCMKSCGRCIPANNPPPSNNQASSSLAALGINAPGNLQAPLNSKGATYRANKARVVNAIRASGMSKPDQTLAFAIGMLETSTFDPNDRDKSKTGGSTNYSQFNMNRDMLQRVGKLSESYNSWSGLNGAVGAIKSCLHTYGVNGFLNYQRGGYTGWKDGVSYDCAGYRNGIASMVRYIDANPSLWTDDRRVDLYVKYQS